MLLGLAVNITNSATSYQPKLLSLHHYFVVMSLVAEVECCSNSTLPVNGTEKLKHTWRVRATGPD